MTAQNAGDTGPRALLPNGLRDVLPPEAAQESEAVRTLLDYMRGFGYQLVKPPLVEFEGSLLDGASPKMGTRIFRVMDPVSQRRWHPWAVISAVCWRRCCRPAAR